MGEPPRSDSEHRVRHERPARRAGGHRAGNRLASHPSAASTTGSRVVIVDDDEWVRRGRAEALRDSPWPAEVVALDHDAALTFAWRRGDTVLVDALDPARSWDRYVCIAVIDAVRAALDGADATVIVLSDGPAPPALRDRAAEAGADHVVAHERLRDLPSVLALVSDPGSVAERLRPGRRGLTAAVRIVEEIDALDLFLGPIPQKQSELTRRNIITLRKRLARALELSPTPRLRDLVAMVNDARGAAGD